MLNDQQLQRLYQYSFSLTTNAHDAQDLLQTAIEKWLRKPANAQQSVQYQQAYIRQIIRNQFIDDCRRQQRIAFEPLDVTEPTLLDSRSLDDLVIDSDQVSKLLQHLNNAEREVLFMWAVLEYSAQEISNEIDLPRGTVLSRLYRLKEKVKHLNNPDSYNANEVSS
jgi:RNA polymerase sigma-70 factor, ECF subfamily